MKKTIKNVSLLLATSAIFGCMSVNAATVDDFEKTFTVTVPEGLVDGQLEKFPLLIRLSAELPGFSYDAFDQDGADILVTDDNGNSLPFELENWDVSGESRLWVQVPTVETGTKIQVFYGSKADMEPVAGMWEGYVGVWHFNEGGNGAVEVLDSTGNGLSGVCHSTSKAVSSGKFGGARFITSNTQNNPGKNSGITIDLSDIEKRNAVDSLPPAFTASFYYRPQSSAANWEYLISRKAKDDTPAWGLQFGDNAGEAFNRIRIYGGASSFATTATVGSAKEKEGVSIPSGGKGQWHRMDCVWSSDATYSLYVDGELAASGELPSKKCAANGTCHLSIGGSLEPVPSTKGGRGFYGDMDEVRLLASAVSPSRIAAEWKQASGEVALQYSEVKNVDESAPVMGLPSVVRNHDGSYKFSVEISGNDAVSGSVKCLIGDSEYAMTSEDEELPKIYSVTLESQNLPANSTMTYSVTAKSVAGDNMERVGAEAFYSGSLTLDRISDADENCVVPGSFSISRADTSHDLVVNIALDGTAVEGKTYRSISRSVTIPAGQNKVEVQVVPLLDPETQNDTSVDVSLDNGLYGFASEMVSITIRNVVLNAWIAESSGSAAIAGNWSLGRVPLSSDHVLFDGRFSSCDCEWDASAPREVAGWTQENSFTGTVTVYTMFPAKAGADGFANLAVSGPMIVNSGFLTHPQSRIMEEQHGNSWDWLGDLLENETYRLRITVDTLKVGSSGVIDARGKGYWITHDDSRLSGCSHGGRMGLDSPPCYGDPREPIHIGMGLHRAFNVINGKGGGAIYIEVRGNAVVDGVIRADAWDGSFDFEKHPDSVYAGAQGAAGSVFIKADSITGRGSITAIGTGCSEEGLKFTYGDKQFTTDENYKGTGGRIALWTRLPVDRSTFTSISAQGNLLGAPNNTWMSNHGGGSGTVVFRDENRPNGLLVIAQQKGIQPQSWTEKSTFHRCPSVSADGNWTFDAIEFGYRGVLRVPNGTALNLPNGFSSCYGTIANANESGGIRYEGGVIDAGDGEQTFSGNWMFVPFSNYVFSADVVVSNGAAIGFHPVTDVRMDSAMPSAFPSCSFEVRGDLFVARDGAIRATDCGLSSTNSVVLGAHSHGGRSLYQGLDENGFLISKAYDSVFSPWLPGLSTSVKSKTRDLHSGGTVNFVVDGTFTLNGVVDVSGLPVRSDNNANNTGGAGGSLCVTAGRLLGAGEMRADGGNCGGYSGPGGRIAVKLSNHDASFSEFSGTIHAGGGSGCKVTEDGLIRDASAGTVYLETASDGTRRGIVRIAMDPVNIEYIQNRIKEGKAGNTNTTELVSLGYGSDNLEDYRTVRYVISDYGRGAVNADFKAASMTIKDLNSILDLEGHILMVDEFLCATDDGNGGTAMRRFGAGSYSAAELVQAGVSGVVDSSSLGTGRVVVRVRGTQVLVR